jgi:dsDNA-specific endonuclease/ATPase MutS2
MSITAAISSPVLRKDHSRAIQIIARTLFRELSAQGYTHHHVINLSTELIQLVTDVLKGSPPEPDNAG